MSYSSTLSTVSKAMIDHSDFHGLCHRIHGAAIYGNIYHQYTPFMLAYIPAPWILWVCHPSKVVILGFHQPSICRSLGPGMPIRGRTTTSWLPKSSPKRMFERGDGQSVANSGMISPFLRIFLWNDMFFLVLIDHIYYHWNTWINDMVFIGFNRF